MTKRLFNVAIPPHLETDNSEMAECLPKLSGQDGTGKCVGYEVRWAGVLISAPSVTGKLLVFLESHL